MDPLIKIHPKCCFFVPRSISLLPLPICKQSKIEKYLLSNSAVLELGVGLLTLANEDNDGAAEIPALY
jgi:hypothetical protein